jgi:RNase P subunit RPR2
VPDIDKPLSPRQFFSVLIFQCKECRSKLSYLTDDTTFRVTEAELRQRVYEVHCRACKADRRFEGSRALYVSANCELRQPLD